MDVAGVTGVTGVTDVTDESSGGGPGGGGGAWSSVEMRVEGSCPSPPPCPKERREWISIEKASDGARGVATLRGRCTESLTSVRRPDSVESFRAEPIVCGARSSRGRGVVESEAASEEAETAPRPLGLAAALRVSEKGTAAGVSRGWPLE